MSDEIKFSCLSCGQRIVCSVFESGREMLCPSCGANVTVPHLMDDQPAPPAASGTDKPTPEVPAPVVASRTSGLAIASFICSLTCIGLIPAIICGHMARSRIRRNPALTGKGLATAGLIISYSTILFTVGLAAYIVSWGAVKFNEAYQQVRLFMATNSPVVAQQAPMPMATNESPQASPASGGWTLDLKGATIPDDPVSGQIHGMDFQLKRTLFRNGNLRFNSSDGNEWVLIHDLGDSMANKSLEVQTASGSDPPRIEIGWKDGQEKKTEAFQEGYAMELKCDKGKGRRVPGQIYLCVPDDSKSYIAGTFTIVLPKPRPKAQAAQ